MNRPMEDRLRAAFDAKTSQVTEGSLSRSASELDGGVDEPDGESLGAPAAWHPRGPARWFKPVAAAAAIAAIAGGVYVGTNRPGTSGVPLSASSSARTGASGFATTGVQPPPLAPTGTSASPSPGTHSTSGTSVPGPASVREAPRAEIPWPQVGPGWTAAVWSTGAGPSSAGMLYLVGPSGTRYAVGQVGAGTQVADITADGRRILTSYSVDGTLRVDSVGDWDVAAGSVRNVPLSHTAAFARYTKPSAQALLLQVDDGASVHLERRGFDGSLQLRYPDVPGFYGGLGPLVTADGRDLVLGTTTGMVVVGNAQGGLVRTLPPPAGNSRCTPVSWWADGRVLASCETTSPATPVSNLWLYPLSGAPASQLTRAPAPGSPFGYMRAWAFSRGTLVQGVPPCGVGPLGLLTPSGTAEHVTLNLPRGDGGPDPVAVVGDTAYLTVASSCGGGGAPSRGLIAYDLVASTSRILLGPGANGGTVVGAVVIDPTR